MAQSRRFFDDVKKELDCPVCQEQFSGTKEPKILKCLHTFCRSCLEAWLARQREGILSCPTCRQITECPNNNINDLPSNLFYKQLVDIVDAYSGGGQDDSPQCGNCEEKNYLKCYCSSCNCFLCEDCAGVHVKGKLFRGHHVKEIRNFQSSDVQDYARRANVCKKHDDEVRFFCVDCQICICRDCAILEHRDHKNISIDEGLVNSKSEIEAKVSEVQRNYSRLRTHRVALEKRRQKISSDIDEATREVKRVAACCVSLIRKHEESVVQQLVKQKEALQDSFEAERSSLDGKLMEIESTMAFCEEVLLRKNLPEILNVKAIIEERLRDLSISRPEDTRKQDYSRVKYVRNDVSFTPGKLITSNTEPLLSVAEGKGLAGGTVGEDCIFTVITKDSAGKDTYSEIDEVQVTITSSSGGPCDLKRVKTLKNGRYTFSYRPTTPGEFTASIKVAGSSIMGSPFRCAVKRKEVSNKRRKIPRDPLENGSASSINIPRHWTPQPKDHKGINIPRHWTPQPKDHKGNEKTVYLHQLDPTNDAQEYQKVQKLFQQSCRNNIVKIERVQNPALYGTYAMRRQKMDETKGSNEKLLFHGTPGGNCNLINHTGFNRSFHGKTGIAYGNGVYFALNASYSARSTCSPPDMNGLRYMYLTRVLVGDYTVGRSGLLTPPARNPSDPTDTYHSVVDQDPNPGIFVVFYDWQCYPDYLITFL